jgi:hypothetical protein
MLLRKRPGTGAPAERAAGAARTAVTLLFLLAMVFVSGVEAAGLHHHQTPGAHPNCAICRVVSSRIETTPPAVTPLAMDLPRAPGEVRIVEDLPALAPSPVHIRLRAPPTA